MLRHPALAVLIAALALGSCQRHPQPEWSGWVWPDEGEFTRSVPLGLFGSQSACEDAALAWVRALPRPSEAHYECGRACVWDQEHRTNRCKAVVRG